MEQRLNGLSEARVSTTKEHIFVLTSDDGLLPAGYTVSETVHALIFGQFDKLTRALAMTFGNVAAIVVVPSLYPEKMNVTLLRRIRQLASAEGAMMIWDESESTPDFSKERMRIGPDLYLAHNSENLHAAL